MARPPAQEPPSPPAVGGSPPAGPVAASPPGPTPPDVRQCGYLRKAKHGHRRFFVLRAGAAARLECYDSEKKWRGGAAAPRRALELAGCLAVHKRADARHPHLVALYTRDACLALAADGPAEQEAWLRALAALLPGPAGAAPPEVWQVSVRARGLGRARGLAGVHRLGLAARAVALLRPGGARPCLTLPLASVRRCGHADGCFFMELGRSAATGPGELWLQADDAVAAQGIHEAVLRAMRAPRGEARAGPPPPSRWPRRPPPPEPSGDPFEDLGSSPGGGDPWPRSSSSTASSNTPDTPPSQQMDGYMAMDRGRLCPRWGVPRKRTCSLTTPAHLPPVPLPLSSASLDEYTLTRATCPSRTAYNPYPEDYCDLEIGSTGFSSGMEEGYMPMRPGVVSAALGKSGSDAYMPMSPASVSAPQQILQPRPYKTSGGCSPEDSGYMHMWGPAVRLAGESPDGQLVNSDYLNMSPLLNGPSTASASPLPSPVGFGTLRPGGQSSCLCGPLAHACQSQLSFLSEGKDSDQYVHMNSPAGMLIQAPKGGTLPGLCNHIVMPLPMPHSQTESSLSQLARLPGHSGRQPHHHSLGTLLLHRNEEPFPRKLQSPSGDYVSLGYSGAPPAGLSSLDSGLGGCPSSPLSNYMNLNLNGSHLGAASVGSVEDVLLPGSCPSLGQPDEHYLKMEMGVAHLSSPSSDMGDYAEVAFSSAATPPQPISHEPESPCVASPVAALKRLTISGVESFLFASPPPDANCGAKVIRVDPQGRRRHSSETFSSTTTVTPVSPSFAHGSKRHNSASVENVSLRKNEGFAEEQNGSPMCRETSAGFQNGLNYIAMDGEGDHLVNSSLSNPNARHPLNSSINDVYARMNFRADSVKEAVSVKE